MESKIKMPTYEYQCNTCGETFEVTGCFSCLANYKPECPNCKSKKIKKIYQSPVIIFRGKGFYQNDKKDKE